MKNYKSKEKKHLKLKYQKQKELSYIVLGRRDKKKRKAYQ